MPGCDIGENNREIKFDQPWLKNAIPFSKGKIDSCYRYALKNETNGVKMDQCSADLFDTSKTIACSEYVYASDEKNVQTEVREFFLLIIFSSILNQKYTIPVQHPLCGQL